LDAIEDLVLSRRCQAMTIDSQEDMMTRALRFDQFGDPTVLRVTDLPDPVASAHEAVVRVEAASVNPSM
jgi:hypothetical protein